MAVVVAGHAPASYDVQNQIICTRLALPQARAPFVSAREPLMSDPIAPYLELFRTQLATTLVPRDDNARKVPIYCHRLLSALLLRRTRMPQLQAEALAGWAALLDELVAEISGGAGGMVLVPQLIEHLRVRPDPVQAEACIQRCVPLLAASRSLRARTLQARLADIGQNLWRGFEQAVREQEPRASKEAQAPSLDAGQQARLLQFLKARFPDEAVLRLGEMKTIIGGGSKLTIIVKLHDARQLPKAVVVRVDHAGGIVDSTVLDEYRLIETVHAAGVRVPQPIAMEADRSILGAPFVIVSCVDGHNIGDWIEVTEPSRAFALGLAETLAKLHGIGPEAVGDQLPGATISTADRVLREIAGFEATWRASGEASIAMEQALAWLRQNIALADGRRAIVHADVGCHNMLAQDGEFTALLDWETAVVGNPAQDLLYTRHTVTQMIDWDEYLAAYEKAGGIRPSEAESRFYHVFIAMFRVYYTYIARAYFFSGLSGALVHGYATELIVLDAQRQLSEAVSAALASELGA